MVKDLSERERGNLLPPLHELLFLISRKDSFICTIPDWIAHNLGLHYTSCGALAGTRNSPMS